MELIKLSAAIIIVISIGWNVLYLLSFKRGGLYLLEKLALSYGLGWGFISLEMLSFYFFKIEFDILKLIAPWTALILINLVIYFKNRDKDFVGKGLFEDKVKRRLAVFLTFGITFEIIYALFRALIKPLEAYDAIAIYAIKSKIFYLARSIPPDFFNNLVNLFPHPDYPLNIQLAETFIYLFLGSLNDQLVKLIFPLYFISTLAVFYYGIRRLASRAYSLSFTFILATIPQFNAYAANAYLELPFSYYYFVGALFLLLWFENVKKRQFLLISAVFMALSGWTKNEGLMYCMINMILMLVFIIFNIKKITRNHIASLFIYFGIIFLITLPWSWIKHSANLVNVEIDLATINMPNLIKQSYKIWLVIYEFQKQFFGPKKWNILWPMALFVIIVNYKRAFAGINKYIAISLFLTISGYILFYLISYMPIQFFLGTTWSRFLMHFLPVLLYWVAVILKEDVNI